MSAKKAPSQKQPVRLELNNSGAWKAILQYDAANGDDDADAQNCADDMGRISARLGGRQAWRVVDMLTGKTRSEWSVEHGWRDA